MGAIDDIRNAFLATCVVNDLERRECKVSLGDTPESRVVIDLVPVDISSITY